MSLTGGRIILFARAANAAARTRRLIDDLRFDGTDHPIVLILVRAGANRGGKDGEIDPLFLTLRRPATTGTIIVTRPTIGSVTPWFGAVGGNPIGCRTIAPRFAIIARFAVVAGLAVVARTRLLALRLIVGIDIIAVAIIVHVRIQPIVAIIVLVVVATALLLVEPRPCVPQHAEIMIRELEIIFGLNAVATKLGVARHALVFLVQLGGVAALAIVARVAAAISGHATWLLSAAAATATVLTIIDQSEVPRRTGAMAPQNLSLEGIFFTPMSGARHKRLDPLSGRVRKIAAKRTADFVGGRCGRRAAIVRKRPRP